jgi:hypothetical protein
MAGTMYENMVVAPREARNEAYQNQRQEAANKLSLQDYAKKKAQREEDYETSGQSEADDELKRRAQEAQIAHTQAVTEAVQAKQPADWSRYTDNQGNTWKFNRATGEHELIEENQNPDLVPGKDNLMHLRNPDGTEGPIYVKKGGGTQAAPKPAQVSAAEQNSWGPMVRGEDTPEKVTEDSLADPARQAGYMDKFSPEEQQILQTGVRHHAGTGNERPMTTNEGIAWRKNTTSGKVQTIQEDIARQAGVDPNSMTDDFKKKISQQVAQEMARRNAGKMTDMDQDIPAQAEKMKLEQRYKQYQTEDRANSLKTGKANAQAIDAAVKVQMNNLMSKGMSKEDALKQTTEDYKAGKLTPAARNVGGGGRDKVDDAIYKGYIENYHLSPEAALKRMPKGYQPPE